MSILVASDPDQEPNRIWSQTSGSGSELKGLDPYPDQYPQHRLEISNEWEIRRKEVSELFLKLNAFSKYKIFKVIFNVKLLLLT
jgi:hypothetical protein